MRRLILCMDGTWNEPDKASSDYDVRRPTNIVKIARAVKPVDDKGISQIVYYDEGVGTHNRTDKILGGLSGIGIVDNILEAYRFLVHNFQPGDEIYLFGFSRGAFTARSLSGLINAIGLLPKNNAYWLPEGYELYRKQANDNKLTNYRNEYNSVIPDIEAICVWDTVGALGIPLGFIQELSRRKYAFHDTELSANVKNGFHALAIDEKREAFKPTLWSKKAHNSQIMEQMWFSGVHSGIGGSYRNDGLANCTLNWMVEMLTPLGLQFDKKYLSFFKSNPLGPMYESRKGMYRLLPKHIRPMGTKKMHNESLYSGVHKRVKRKDPKYKPKNLIEYLKANKQGG